MVPVSRLTMGFLVRSGRHHRASLLFFFFLLFTARKMGTDFNELAR